MTEEINVQETPVEKKPRGRRPKKVEVAEEAVEAPVEEVVVEAVEDISIEPIEKPVETVVEEVVETPEVVEEPEVVEAITEVAEEVPIEETPKSEEVSKIFLNHYTTLYRDSELNFPQVMVFGIGELLEVVSTKVLKIRISSNGIPIIGFIRR